MKTKIRNFFLAVSFLGCGSLFAQTNHVVWFNRPAQYFEETLVLGNGKMGATVFGGVETEKIYLNDATLWSGEPVKPSINPDAHKHIPAIREALKKGNYKMADSLNRKVQGPYSQSYAPLGTLLIHFIHNGQGSNYYRELDLSKAISKTSYEVNGVKFQREYFVSHPAQVMAIRLTSSAKGALNFSVGFNSLLKYQIAAAEKGLAVNGYAPYHVEPSYRVNIPNPVLFDKDRGTRFTSLVQVKNTDGKVQYTDSSILVNGASEAVLLVSAATSFNGFDKNPATQGANNQELARNISIKALEKSYDALKKAHAEDFSKYFDRVKLDFGKVETPDMPVDDRLKRYSEGVEDKGLEILYFNFGRYLLISSSRTIGVPANLQGIWNPYIRPPWSCNYTLNINAEENYWLAENTNLSEMHLPLLSYIGNVAKTGEATAKNFYGVGGWTACHNSDIWAMSNPVGDYGEGEPRWTNWNMAGAWLCTHLWEHYAFTGDLDFLKNNAYPLMKGAAQFCLEWLVEDADGYLITSPCTSPENRYLTPEGYKGDSFFGGSADISMIRELFHQTISASGLLNTDADFRKQLEQAYNRLLPYKVGAKGNLQEWYFDWADSDPKHRHQSHLFGLYPGHQITPLKTPALAQACRKTLEIKGDKTTGWSKGWRINLWARLQDGNRAYKLYRELLQYVEPDDGRIMTTNSGGTYPNLFDAHPPFQIDGNFGGAAAVIEMLMQSTENEIYMLPALPDTWDKGSVKGICARGGFELSMEWENKAIKRVAVSSKNDAKTTLFFGGKQKQIALKKGQKVEIDWEAIK